MLLLPHVGNVSEPIDEHYWIWNQSYMGMLMKDDYEGSEGGKYGDRRGCWPWLELEKYNGMNDHRLYGLSCRKCKCAYTKLVHLNNLSNIQTITSTPP